MMFWTSVIAPVCSFVISFTEIEYVLYTHAVLFGTVGVASLQVTWMKRLECLGALGEPVGGIRVATGSEQLASSWEATVQETDCVSCALVCRSGEAEFARGCLRLKNSLLFS